MILIFGNGWIGNMLTQYYGSQAFLLECHIRDYYMDEDFDKYKIIINTGAKTNIDWCEKNRVEAFRNNVEEAVKLAHWCKKNQRQYVFFSSACVFESIDEKDIKYEDSYPTPKCFYSETKVMAERLISEIYPPTLIVRPRLPISETPHPRNTLDKLNNYPFINNAQESVTVIEDMLSVLDDLIRTEKNGAYHLINSGTISPAELADLMGHSYTLTTKQEQDERIAKEGRAKRVTVIAGSKKIKLLPDIRKRAPEVVKLWKSRKLS